MASASPVINFTLDRSREWGETFTQKSDVTLFIILFKMNGNKVRGEGKIPPSYNKLSA